MYITTHKDEQMEYPLTLSYTCPHTGIKITVVCKDEEKADQEFQRMFDRCGQDVAYSVD